MNFYLENNTNPLPMRLKQARKRKGLSQKSLGILAGIDEFVASPRMNQYEKGKHFPDYGLLQKIAAVLNVPTAFFFCENDDLATLLLAINEKDEELASKTLALLFAQV